MIVALTASLLLRASGVPSDARCSLVVSPLPARTDTYVVLRTTSDSASDGSYYASSFSGVSRSPSIPAERPRVTIGQMPARAPGPPPQRAHEVYGQVMEVVRARGAGASTLPRGRRVLVVWWGLGASCQRAYPQRALHAEPGELFLQLSPRDSTGWTAGMPTYDVGPGVLTYSPRGRQQSAPPAEARPMSMREFLDLYGVLPASEVRDRDPVAALAPLLEWAVRHRNRAVKQPALFYVCAAQGEAEQRRLPECEAPQASR